MVITASRLAARTLFLPSLTYLFSLPLIFLEALKLPSSLILMCASQVIVRLLGWSKKKKKPHVLLCLFSFLGESLPAVVLMLIPSHSVGWAHFEGRGALCVTGINQRVKVFGPRVILSPWVWSLCLSLSWWFICLGFSLYPLSLVSSIFSSLSSSIFRLFFWH